MKKEKNKNSLGFIFAFKEVEKNNNNSFTVKFKTGISQKFPSKYQKFKDFWAEEILIGQTSEIYINPENFKEAFAKELIEFGKDHDYFSKQFEERKHFFTNPVSIEQYGALHSFSMAHLHFNPCLRWENEKTLEKSLNETIGQYFKNDKRTVLEINEDYNNVSKYIYDQSIKEALGEIEEAKSSNKLKI